MGNFKRTLILFAALVAVAILGCQKSGYELLDSDSLQYADPACKISLNKSEAMLAESIRSEEFTVLPDACLFAAARAIAIKIAHEKKELSSDDIRKIFLSYGITDGQIGIRTYTAPRTKVIVKDVSKSLAEELVSGGYTHFGAGTFHKLYPPRVYAVFAVTKKTVFLNPFPKNVFRPTGLLLSGKVKEGYENPSILFSNPDGKTISTDLSKDESGNFEIELPFESKKPGTYIVELEVEGERGPEVGALFSVNYMAEGFYPGVEPEAQKSGIVPDGVTSSKNLLLTWVNQERTKRELNPLIEDPRLTALAQRRAERMLTEGRARHLDIQGFDAADEAESKGIEFKRLGENLAFNPDLYQAHKSLMESPSHRQNILAPYYTHIGLGIAIKEEKDAKLFAIVEIFVER